MRNDLDIKKIKSNKKQLIEKTAGKVISYSQFIEEAKQNKYTMFLRNAIRNLEEKKLDFESKKLDISFEIENTGDLKFGKKKERRDSYIIDKEDLFKASIIEYFNEVAKIKTKDKSIIDRFNEVLNNAIENLGDSKELNFSFDGANINIKLEPVSNFVEIYGSKGPKIDLSK